MRAVFALGQKIPGNKFSPSATSTVKKININIKDNEMNIKKTLLASTLAIGTFMAAPAFSANLECHIYVRAGGHAIGNGTSNCFGQDFSFGNSTSGKYTITNISKSIDRVNWIKGCSSGLECSVTVRAYSTNRAEAYIHYDDGSIEFVDAQMQYETGH
jgi:hypothetical protein